jgi:hypothetical protein
LDALGCGWKLIGMRNLHAERVPTQLRLISASEFLWRRKPLMKSIRVRGSSLSENRNDQTDEFWVKRKVQPRLKAWAELMSADRELWPASEVLRHHGDRALLFVAERIGSSLRPATKPA